MAHQFPSLYTAHPWHGVSLGDEAPQLVYVYIEIVPTDTLKFEIDKQTGLLKVDRPQKYSNICPQPYGFLPQTYSGDAIAKRAQMATGKTIASGDGDPIDICVLTERPIPRGGLLLEAKPIGGLCFLDKGEADDKLIAVLKGDVFDSYRDLSDCPKNLIDRLEHYFLTYKTMPQDNHQNPCELIERYGRDTALEVIRLGQQDYQKKFSSNE